MDGGGLSGSKPFGGMHEMMAARHNPKARRGGYVLLETVVATGLLVLGLAVLGSQVHHADKSIRRMDLQMRALMLAEMQLAHLDTGLIEINSIDDVEEKDFGPRYPSYGWRLTTDETRTENLFRLTLEILHYRRNDYDSDEFDYDEAEVLYTFYLFRAKVQPLNFAQDFGLREEELTDLADKLQECSGGELDPEDLDPRFLATLDLEQLIKCLPVIAQSFGQTPEQVIGGLPPEYRDLIESSGMFGELFGGEGDANGGGGR